VETATGRTRYHLLAIVREYARAQLQEDRSLEEQAQERHAQHYLAFAEERLPAMRSRDEASALADLRDELDNLRAALATPAQSRRPDLQARLAVAAYEPLYRLGFWEESRGYLRDAATALNAAAQSGSETIRLRGLLSHHLAVLAHDMGDLTEARQQSEASLALYRSLDDRPGTAEALNLLGLFAMDAGDAETAEQRLQEALTLLAPDDFLRRGKVLHNLARLASRRGQAEQAERLYQEALGCRRAASDARGEAETLANLGVISHEAGDLAAADQQYRESLSLYRSLDDRHGIAVMLNNLGELAELSEAWETAARLFLHAERIFRDLHSAFLTAPQQRLAQLAARLSAERWAALRAEAEQGDDEVMR
jgi:tetratricopeptide (TPR) repeat protein